MRTPMHNRSREGLRYNKHWNRGPLRKGRYILVLTVSVVALALYSALRYLSRAGYFNVVKKLGLGDPLWSYSHMNASDSRWPPHDPTYIVFEPRRLGSNSLEITRRLPENCIDALFTTGRVCHSAPDLPLDVVWTWVNGSDRLVQKSIADTARNTSGEPSSTSRSNTQFFRDHDELRHSIRSVLKHFGKYTKQMHILTSDFPIVIPIMLGEALYNKTRRLGLVPRWLDIEKAEKWEHQDVRLEMQYHSEIFNPYNGSSFNSYAIESQLVNLQGISENFIYMNDDFFMMADLSPADFYTSSYGTVLRMQSDFLVKTTENPHASPGGEWGPLEFTNFLLSKRFGSRKRPYTTHAAKALSVGLMKEFSLIWQPELTITASHPFRGMKDVHRDVYSVFLSSHFLVERWREALIWSWAVAKVGGLDGQWGPVEKERAWRDVGGHPGQNILNILKTKRITVDDDVVEGTLRAAGHRISGKTKYEFSSGDGYPYGYRNSKGALSWPSFASAGERLCSLNYQECFAQDHASASDFFKSIAFAKTHCGDCIIHALRGTSGPSGLAAFLPDARRNYTTKPRNRDNIVAPKNPDEGPPHLPLVSDWRHGDFSLRGIITSEKEVNIRELTLRLLERYRFVIGQTPTLFHQITSATAARIKLQKIDESKDVALLCLNDDIRGLARQADRVLFAWQEKKWGSKADWEL